MNDTGNWPLNLMNSILLVEEYDSSGYLDLLLSFRGIPIIALKRVRIEHFRHRFSLLFGPKFLCKYHPLIGGEPQRFWPKVVSLCLGRPVGQTILQKKCRLVFKSYCLTYLLLPGHEENSKSFH